MKRFNRIVSLALSVGMIFSAQSFVLAKEDVADVLWNRQYVYEGSEDLYLEFPVQIDKTIRKDMTMDMSFRYLKNIGVNDSVEITISDADSNDVCIEEILTSDDSKVIFKNVPNDMVYRITVNEQLNGVSNEYVGFIKTQFVQTDFPVNMKLGNVDYNNHDGNHSNVLIKKVGDSPECLHDMDEECTEACGMGSIVSEITSDELDSFYSELDSNAYYELQTEASAGGKTEFYQGFISTYTYGEYDGVFSRGYSFCDTLEETYSNPVSYAASAVPDFSNAYNYEFYQNEHISNLTYSDEYIIKFVAPETGYYTIETIGNADTMFKIYSETNGVIDTASPRTVRRGGEGENARSNIGLLVDEDHHPVRYIVLTLENGSSAPCAFRIIRDDYETSDDFSNFRDEIQANCEAGIYSAALNNNCWIDYNGDVDIFGYNVSKGDGYIDFPYVNRGQELEATIYSVTTEKSPFDSCWREDVISSDEQSALVTFSAGRHYIEVRQAKSMLPAFGNEADGYYDYVAFKYGFNFYDPKHKDPVDLAGHSEYGNDTPIHATEITTFPYTRSDLTLHRSDNDYFKFTTGSNGGNLSVSVTKADTVSSTYIPHLFDAAEVEIINTNPPEWSVPVDMANYVTSNNGNRNTLTYNGLLANHEYYVEISKPNSSTYSSKYPYTLTIDLTVPDIPSAVLTNDVSLAHTIGEDITSTTALINTVMESLTCYINNVAVSDSTAIEDVELYYNNAILTPAMVNVMGAGTYPLVVKYQGAVATGGVINLVVSSAPIDDNIIMLENIQLEKVTTAAWDWAATARILANTRLLREGSPQTTYTVQQAIMAVKTGGYTTRGTIEEVVKAANYFYSGGSLDTYNFINDIIDISTAESTLANALSNGQAVIMQLTSISNPSDLNSMRYVVLYGINLTTHEYIVYDPVLNKTLTVLQDNIHNGGYNGNADLKFTGQVIEFL